VQWTELIPPVPLSEYTLKVGTSIKVRYTGGLASNPTTREEELLVGNVNILGGLCDCCSMKHQFANGVVLAEAAVVKLVDTPA
jgi:hypothetical protein